MSAADHRERYREHARRLQTWLGAYAAGLASLLVIHFHDGIGLAPTKMLNSLSCSLRLIGLALSFQVFLLLTNKFTQYYVADVPEGNGGSTFLEKAACRITMWFWVDVVCDLATVGLLTIATIRGLSALGVPL